VEIRDLYPAKYKYMYVYIYLLINFVLILYHLQSSEALSEDLCLHFCKNSLLSYIRFLKNKNIFLKTHFEVRSYFQIQIKNHCYTIFFHFYNQWYKAKHAKILHFL